MKSQWVPITEFRNNERMTIGDRIRATREAAKMSRAELAERSGVPYPTLAGLEVGDQKQSTRLPALAAALGVSALWLSTGKGHKEDTAMNGSGPLPPDNADNQQGRASHSGRMDPDRLAAAMRFTRYFLEARGQEPAIEEHPKLVLVGYDLLEAIEADGQEGDFLEFTKRMAARLRETGGIDGLERGSAT